MSEPVKKPLYFAVIGNPIRHSKSPLIHTLFGEQTGLDICYIAIEAPIKEFTETVEDFHRSGGLGLNVTVPFKVKAWELADESSARASYAQAVNTLTFRGGRILGDNTDGVGLVRDIQQNLKTRLQGATVLLLGAGGAVRGVMAPLLNAGVKSVTLANRTAQKAVDLASSFQSLGEVAGGGYGDLDHLMDQPFDIVINGTVASLSGELPPLAPTIFGGNALTYDMMSADKPTVFLQWAAANGASRVSDGLGMLVEQAAESFFIWNGVRPETRPVIKELRK